MKRLPVRAARTSERIAIQAEPYAPSRISFIDRQSPVPGSFASQNVQPLVGVLVIAIAADEGESCRFPSNMSASSLTSARYSWPLYFARTWVPCGNRTPLATQSPGRCRDSDAATLLPAEGNPKSCLRTSFSVTSSDERRTVIALNTSKST